MTRKPAPTVRDPQDRFQRDTRDTIASLSDVAILNGVEVQDVDLTTTTTRVYHNLGRPARGFFVTDSTEDVRVWRDADFVGAPTMALGLVASVPTTVSLWIF